MKNENNENEIEEEQLYSGAFEREITEPFNPKDVDIISQTMVISNIIDQLKCGDILLEPDFQRHPDLWNDKKQSRLIESLMIRIPLPTFYFDSTEDDKLIVVDGLQRLYAIKRFMVLGEDDEKRLKLTDLEYLKEYEDRKFEELPPNMQRRIKTQTLTTYVIRPGTPDKVRTSIFTRINTGGLTLEPAEIYLLGIEAYSGNLEDYLNDVMIRLQKESEATIRKCRTDFLKAMKYAACIFDAVAFRKITANGRYGRINKPLYDAVTVNLAKLSVQDCKSLLKKKDKVMEKYIALLMDKKFIRRFH